MLPPPRGNRGSSSFSRETAEATAGFESELLGGFELDFDSAWGGLSDFANFEGRESLRILADLAADVPPGASFRLRALIVLEMRPDTQRRLDLKSHPTNNQKF